ncbi:MAG TPA: hypothetical protein VFB00_04395, partial [Terriglobales bacterium]|nr:hypothetical protein [Terriglobales bacterium]
MRPQSALWVLAVAMLLAASAWGQIFGVSSTNFGGATVHGVPPSVTSFGFGGTPGFRGVPPSVTSLNFSGAPVHTFAPGFGFRGRPPGFGHHRGFGSPFPGAVYYVPYAYPVYVMEPGVDDTMEEDYRGGPTIFDRRGPGPHEYTQRRAVEVEPEDYRTDIHRHTPEAEPVQ